MNRRQSWNIVTLFCILIFGFTLATFVAPDREYSEAENRTLAKRPHLTAESLLSGEFEKDYEDYLTDQFVLRDGWIGLKTAVERLTFRQESKDIYFAEDGYLIEKHTGVFTGDQAEANIDALAAFAEEYQDRFSGKLSVILVPNAVSVLSDKLPLFASPYNEDEYLGRVAEALPQGSWFDAGEVLREHTGEQLFYRTDHHWTTGAAFHVYQAWAGWMGLPVPQADAYDVVTVTDEFEGTIQSKLGIETRKDSIELYLPLGDPFYTVQAEGQQEVEYSLYDYTKLETKDKYGVFLGGNQALVRIRSGGEDRKILVVKDSYANCFIPFLLSDFAAIDVLDVRYYNQKVSDLIEQGGYTDLLVLYNAAGFAQDASVARLAY